MQPISSISSSRYSRSRDLARDDSAAADRGPFRTRGQVPTYRVSLGRPSASDPHAYFTPRESAYAYNPRTYERMPPRTRRAQPTASATTATSATRNSASQQTGPLGLDWINETVSYSRQQHIENSSSAVARRSYLAGAHQPRTYGRKYYQQRDYPLDYGPPASLSTVAPRYSNGISTSDAATTSADPAHASYHRAPPPPPTTHQHQHPHDPRPNAHQPPPGHAEVYHGAPPPGTYAYHPQHQQQPYYHHQPHPNEHYYAYQRGPLDVSSPPGPSLSSASSPSAATGSPSQSGSGSSPRSNQPQQSADPLRQQIYRLVTQALGLQDQGQFDEARQIISVIEQLQKQAESDYESKGSTVAKTKTSSAAAVVAAHSQSNEGGKTMPLPMALQPVVASVKGKPQKQARARKPRKASAVLDQVHAERMISALTVEPAPVPLNPAVQATGDSAQDTKSDNIGEDEDEQDDDDADDEEEMDAEMEEAGELSFSDDEEPREDQVIDTAPVVSSLAEEAAKRKQQMRQARLERQASEEVEVAVETNAKVPATKSYASAAAAVDELVSPVASPPSGQANGLVNKGKDATSSDMGNKKEKVELENKKKEEEEGNMKRRNSLVRSSETERDEDEYGVPLILAPPEEAEIFRTLVSRSRFREQQVGNNKSNSGSSADAAAASKPNPAAEAAATAQAQTQPADTANGNDVNGSKPEERPSVMLTKEGFMRKAPPQGRWLARWRDRYFILSGRLLVYFKSATSKVPAGILNLENATVGAVKIPRDLTNKPHDIYEVRIHLQNLKRTHRLRCETKRQVVEWTLAITNNIAVASRQHDLPPEERRQPKLTEEEVFQRRQQNKELRQKQKQDQQNEFMARARSESKLGNDITIKDAHDDMLWHYYAVLNVSATAGHRLIKKNFYKLAKDFHPDKNPDVDTVRFAEINRAFQALKDDGARESYDLQERVKMALRRGILVNKHEADGSVKTVAMFLDSRILNLYWQDAEHGTVLAPGYKRVELRFVQMISAGRDSWENCPRNKDHLCLSLLGERMQHETIHLELDSEGARDEFLDGLRIIRCAASTLFKQNMEEHRDNGVR